MKHCLLNVCREADAIFIEELHVADLYDKISQVCGLRAHYVYDIIAILVFIDFIQLRSTQLHRMPLCRAGWCDIVKL